MKVTALNKDKAAFHGFLRGASRVAHIRVNEWTLTLQAWPSTRRRLSTFVMFQRAASTSYGSRAVRAVSR
jgi:hypothetical protein